MAISAGQPRPGYAGAMAMALHSGAVAHGGDTSFREGDFSRRTCRREK